MKNLLNKDLIEDLNESNNEEFINKTNELVYSLAASVLNDLSEKSPFVRADKCIFQAVNEAFLGTFTQLSEFSYFLGIDNPQIEMNTKRIRNIFKFMWREFKAGFRLGKKKYKRKKKHEETSSTVQPLTKYKLSDMTHDFVQILANYLNETSIIYEYRDHISIIGQDDFGTGVRINIYFCCYDARNDVYKLYKENKNKFLTLSFGSRFDNLNNKIEKCGQQFVDIIKIFNAIYSKTYNKVPNQVLLESLVYNCPNNLFEKELYTTFVNVANYISITTPQAMVSICDANKSIFEEPLIIKANHQIQFTRILNMLSNFKY